MKSGLGFLDVVGIVLMISLAAVSLAGVGLRRPEEAAKAVVEAGYKNPVLEDASPLECLTKVSRHLFVAENMLSKTAVKGVVCCGLTEGSCKVVRLISVPEPRGK